MKQKLFFLLKNFIFWVFLSVVAKVLFLFYQGMQSVHLETSDIYNIFLYGLRMDASLAGYTTMLSAVLLLGSLIFKPSIIRNVLRVVGALLLFFFFSVVIVDLELFVNWGYHIDATPLLYLKTPAAALASTPAPMIAGLFILCLLFTYVFYMIYNKLIVNQLEYKYPHWSELPILLICGGAMILPIRGGLNVAPMNSSFVFFHPTNMFANQCAINPVWNFIYEVTHIGKMETNYDFFENEEEVAVVTNRKSHDGDSTLPHYLNGNRPNIVFILLESFTANAIESLGGAKGVTPNLDSLAREGILFSNIYATAGRSDRGMVAAISAIPSHPEVAIIKYPNKTVQYPRFPKELEKLGYHTRFYYAGDINFGSFRSYTTMSFQEIVTENDFSGEAIENRFKWGVHDQYMFDRLAEDLKSAKQPFCYMAFNMSSHEPFNVPMQSKFSGEDIESKFLNSIHYSDSCIGAFVKECKQNGVWDNTLFVFMADHGTRHIGNLDPLDPKMYHIPLIFTGGVLNTKNKVVDRVGSQVDMIATLFGQLGIDHSKFVFSRDLLKEDSIPSFAMYSYSGAVGAVTANGNITYDLKGKKLLKSTTEEDEMLMKSMLQKVDEVTK